MSSDPADNAKGLAGFQRDEAFALEHQRREGLPHALHFSAVGLVRVFLDRKLLLIGIVARIDTNLLDPFHRFHGRFRFEMNVRDDRHTAALGAEFMDNVF